MKKNAILMLLCILCNSGFSQNNYYDSGCDTGEYDKIQSEISTKELDQREPYILKRGNSLVYYSYKSKFSRLGVRNQDYSQPFQGFLDGPQDFFTLELLQTLSYISYKMSKLIVGLTARVTLLPQRAFGQK